MMVTAAEAAPSAAQPGAPPPASSSAASSPPLSTPPSSLCLPIVPTKSEGDDRTYRIIALPNALRCLLIHDEETDKASAAMDVGVGHWCDPPHLPGLAHFLEHMLFLGTERYPDEAEYNSFLNAHGQQPAARTARTDRSSSGSGAGMTTTYSSLQSRDAGDNSKGFS